jgi:hypothetical protein
MNKKVNIKKFFSKFTKNSIVYKIFEMHNIQNIPHVMDTANAGKIDDTYFDFYKGLEIDDRENVISSIEEINKMASFDAHIICKKYMSSTNPTPFEVLAESYHDKAAAFYFDHFEKVSEVLFIISFYKKNGYKVFQAKGKVEKDIEIVDVELKTRFAELLEVNIGSQVIAESKTVKYDDMYMAKVSYKDGGEKEIFLVYIPESKEVLVKATGSKEIVFSYAESYIKKLTGDAMDYSEREYDMQKFLDTNNEVDTKSPIYDNPHIISWYVKSVKMLSGKNNLSMTFKKSDEEKYMSAMYSAFADFNILKSAAGNSGLKMVNVTLNFEVSKSDYNAVKKNISVSIKDNITSLNLLKKEHRLIDDILKNKVIMLGYKAINSV